MIRLAKKHPFYHIEKVTASYNKWSDELQVNNLLNEKIMRNNQLIVLGRYLSDIPTDFLMNLWQQHQHECALIENYKNELQEKESVIENRQSIINDMEKTIEKERTEISSLQETLHTVHLKFDARIKEQEKIIENRQSIINDMEEALEKERTEISSLQETLHTVHLKFDARIKEQEKIIGNREELIEIRQTIINDLEHALEKERCEIQSLQQKNQEADRQFEVFLNKESEYIAIINRCKEELNKSIKEKNFFEQNLLDRERNFQNEIDIRQSEVDIRQNEIDIRQNEIVQLHQRLEIIHISLAWRLIVKYRCMLDKIVPEGSIARKSYLTLRKYLGVIYRFILRIKKDDNEKDDKEMEQNSKSPSLSSESFNDHCTLESRNTNIVETRHALSLQLESNLESDTVLLVSHDFEKAGAQINLLHAGKSLKSKYGKNVIFIALQDGAFRYAFERVGNEVIDLNQHLGGELQINPWIENVFRDFKQRGIDKCICNTVVSGILAPVLTNLGFCFINLIHELPVTIDTSNFYQAIPAMKQYASTLVFSSEYARNAYISNYGFKKSQTLVQPQGSYFKSIPPENKEEIRRNIRNQLFLTQDTKIILSCGYMTLRKGPDLFISLAGKILKNPDNRHLHFVWLGGYELEIMNWLKNDIYKMGISANIHFVDFVDDPSPFFAGADIFTLTSREDPFPTVVLESMDNGIPAVAFDEAGGIPELLSDDCGIIVPYLDVDAMMKEILLLLADRERYQLIADNAGKRIEQDYNFDRYTGFLLELLDKQSSENIHQGVSKGDPRIPKENSLNTSPETDKNLLFVQSLFAKSLLDSSRKTGEHQKPFKHNPPVHSEIRMIAFYLPQFHPVVENDEWWGKGFTEWTNVSKALPQFVGHDQPRLPGELGFYDLRLIDIQKRQAELAVNYGIHGFCYYYYWFGGRRILERPLEQLMGNPDIDFPFCLCWANENWSRRWDGSEDDILLKQNYSSDCDEKFIQDISVYFSDKRYIKVNEKPLLLVYRAELLPDPVKTIHSWRNWCRDNNIGEIYLCNVHSFEGVNPESIGFDAAVEFPPNTFPVTPLNDSVDVVNPDYKGTIYDYRQLADISKACEVPNYTKHRGITTGWDNEPRRPAKGTSFINSTPEIYEKWLSHLAHFTENHFKGGEKMIFINAWNEWAEGAYLEPDKKNGYAYLEASYAVLSKFETEKLNLIKSSSNNIKKEADIAVIVHLFYVDLWREIAAYLENIPEKFDLYISVSDYIQKEFLEEIIQNYPDVHFFSFENRGRDILPFINIFKDLVCFNYKYICKIHSKKSIHTDVGQQWRTNIYKELLGSPEQIRKILNTFNERERLGILAPRGYLIRLNDCLGYNDELALENMHYIEQFLNELQAELIEDECFVTGTMFWFRPEALQRMLLLHIPFKDYPMEAGQIDGTIMHSLERIITLCARISGYQYTDTTILDTHNDLLNISELPECKMLRNEV